MRSIKKIISTCALIFCLMFMPMILSGCGLFKDKEIKVRVEEGYIQWQEDGDDSWSNVISVEDVLAAIGDDIKGKEIELQKTDTHIQWRYQGGAWQNLIALEEIKGQDLVATDCTITYNFNLGRASIESINNQLASVFACDGFEQSVAKVEGDDLVVKYTQTDKKGNFFNLYDRMDDLGLSDYFLGWYVDDIKVNPLHIIGGDIELTAKWTKSLTKIMCTEICEYSYYNFDGNNTASVSPVEGHTYSSSNGLRIFSLNELTIHEGEFYKITQFSAYSGFGFVEDERDVDIIVVPETMEKNVAKKIDMNWTHDLPLFFISNKKTDGTIGGSLLKDCIIDNLVVKPVVRTGGASGIIEYIYEVDYETCEAKLIKTFVGRNWLLKDGFNNNNEVLGDFTVVKDGKSYDIKVTEFSDGWIKPFYTFKYTSDNDTFNINFILSKDITFIGGGHYMDSSYNGPEDLGGTDLMVYHFFSLCTDVTKEITSELVGAASPQTGIAEEQSIIYYYSETEPTDTEHKYWHYDDDGKTPIIWEVNA